MSWIDAMTGFRFFLINIKQILKSTSLQRIQKNTVSLFVPYCCYNLSTTNLCHHQNIVFVVALLKSYGISDHEVRQLKQTVEGAIYSFFELLFIFLLSILIGVPLSLLWGPIRVISSHLAERHRQKALAESKVKIKGRDVVAR